MYTSKQSKSPQGFKDFVSEQELTNDPNQVQGISIYHFGPNADKGQRCTVDDTEINCIQAFNNLSAVTYTWNNGAVTANIMRKTSN
jgi:hypothetical protein